VVCFNKKATLPRAHVKSFFVDKQLILRKFLQHTSIKSHLPSLSILSPTTAIMGAKDVLSRKAGVIVGDDVLKLFNYAQENKFAIPAIVSSELDYQDY
jgi:hypothetical protein